MFRISLLLTIILLLSGCSHLFSPRIMSADDVPLPESYSIATTADKDAGFWWKAFGSEELDRLVDEALNRNFDIRTAWARLKQAEQEARQAGADLMPSVTGNAGAEKDWRRTKTRDTSATSSNSENFSIGVSAAYEVDLWGRLSSLKKSELLSYEAANADLDAAAVTVSATIVETWIDILSYRKQIGILEDQININENLLELQKYRFSNGKGTALDLSQQVVALASAKARMPLLQLSLAQNINAMAVLIGRTGSQELSLTQADLPDLIPVPGTGIPSDLLSLRPDVRAAELRLQSSNWRVAAAKADRLPALSLNASGTFSSDKTDLIFQNWAAALAASITGPIFDAGHRRAEVDRVRAQVEEYLASYTGTVAGAIREVEDCLATETRQQEYLALLKDQLSATRLSMRDAHVQYMNGKDNYLDYLTAWTSVQSLERQLVEEQATMIKNRVDLYRALGGDWTHELVPESNAAKTEASAPLNMPKSAIAG